MQKCLVCKEPTIERTKGVYTVHSNCRKEIPKFKEKLVEKAAKDVYEKLKGLEIFDNYEELLEHSRNTISTMDTLKALERGEFDEDKV